MFEKSGNLGYTWVYFGMFESLQKSILEYTWICLRSLEKVILEYTWVHLKSLEKVILEYTWVCLTSLEQVTIFTKNL